MWHKIEKILIEKGMSQATLAKKAGIRSGDVTDLKKGRIKKPSFDLVCKLADALEITLEDLRR
ncbi:gp51 [Brochothrix phage NF5]|uniref:gp51 n=1 Tax=Brochothrix phage NF5 TaxID=764561 RepID=UPI0001D9ACBE|nr:gp51 [Brochothrix phage NF5]ADH03073.1 gp51 [Brochothrix phage NF5]